MVVVVQVDGRAGSTPIQIEVTEVTEVPHAGAPAPAPARAPASASASEVYDGEATRDLRDKVVKLARPLFSEALDLVGSCAEEVRHRLEEMPGRTRPDEFEMQFAVKLDARFGAAIVEATSGAQLQVVLRWKGRDGD
jgi:hypothetical protein